MIRKIAALIIFLVLYVDISAQVNQIIEEGSLIDKEMQKIQDEFTETAGKEVSIPPSKLLEELQKPGNENLLEQLRNGGTIKIEDSEFNIEDLKNLDGVDDKDPESDEQKENETDEDDDKLKVSSNTEIFFDMAEYFNSVKDFYGYRVFILSPEDEEDNKARAELYTPRNPEHQIGPGDSFLLTVWGDTEFQRRITVTSEGTVYIENIGVIPVHGLTIKELEIKLKKALSRKFSTIDPSIGNPTTFFDVYFDKLNIVNVFVTGEINMPGAYEMSPNSTIISALIKAKGVTAKGTLRNIHLIRDGKTVKEFDLYDYLQSGKNVQDIVLKNNDNIFVGTRINTVELKGEVLNPMKYEIKKGETLEELMRYSGGLLATAAIDQVTIERIVPIEKRTSPVVYSNILTEIFTEKIDNSVKVRRIELYDRDIIIVHSIPRVLTEYVAVEGAVYRKGRFSYNSNMTIGDLLNKTGGLLADAYTDKIEIIRTKEDLKKEYKSLCITDEKNYDFALNTLDSIKIHSYFDLQSKKLVIINGYVKNPGFQYLADSTRVSDLIFSSGGILDEWRKNRTYLLIAELTRYNEDGVTTRIINLNLERILSGEKEEDIFLQDGDQLMIYDLYMIYNEGRVFISGYVKNEGEFRLSSNMTVEDLILKANGFREGAYEYKAVVFRMNTDQAHSDSLSKVYEVQLEKDFLKRKDVTKSKFLLRDNDHVVIRRSPYYREMRKVTLSGEVQFPGVYTLIKQGETLNELIERAGGLTEEAFIDGIVLYRDSLNVNADFSRSLSSNKNGIALKDGDDINVPKHPGTVMVEGYVYTPGLIKYRMDWDLGDYIEAAGGEIVELDFKAGNAVVYYPGGNAEVDGWFFSPDVKEGSKIVVPQIKREAFKEWRAEIGGWLGVITTSLTLVLLYQAAQN